MVIDLNLRLMNIEFFELAMPTFEKALACLESQSKAVVFTHDGNTGVKFLH
jgi:hypothetical protein